MRGGIEEPRERPDTDLQEETKMQVQQKRQSKELCEPTIDP
jgi:hypothetical protein